MEGDRASTIAFNARRARFNRYVEFNSTALIFQVDITLAAEGVEPITLLPLRLAAPSNSRSRPARSTLLKQLN